ncbi:MAG: nuclear transport factor 2 family protein [Methanobacteriota archaeon]|nr:MAG: nuclear transport factor 2 family protein [Euryarchaeota archaeon]
MTNAKDVVNGFQKALGKGDFEAARTFLDDHLKFVGPFESFDRPEPYLASLERLHHIIARVEPKKMFVDGDDVCLLYDMVTNTPAGTAFISEWHQVRGDKIAAIRVVFDPRPFVPMFNR